MAKGKIIKLKLKSGQRYQTPDAMLATVEKNGGEEAAIDVACQLLDVVTDYLIRKRSAARRLLIENSHLISEGGSRHDPAASSAPDEPKPPGGLAV
jgi:hypothetical protein